VNSEQKVGKEMNTNDKPMTIKMTRIYAENGKSHYGEVEIAISTHEFAPPSPPINQSARFPAQNIQYLIEQPGWTGDWHPAPARLLFIVLAGACWQEVSNGERREFKPGDFCLVDDKGSQGHRSGTIGNDALMFAVVQLADTVEFK
jgi:hypothetical protein